MNYRGPAPDSAQPEVTGILLLNLGTPDSTRVSDVRRYLREFLSDPRVVELPRLLWWLILNLVILTTRPKRSAQAYRQVWTEQGSPLLFHSSEIGTALQQQLGDDYHVVLAMRYGSPSIAAGLEQLRQSNARRVLVLPLYPQYSATTTASTFDAISNELQRWRWLPELRFINHYYQEADYIEALSQSVKSFQAQHGTPERLLMSFHGIPKDYADAGDPYAEECRTSAELLAKQLGLSDEQWAISFQSRLGRQEWLKPYTDETLKSWAKNGVKDVQVICPGFPADCLETIEEIGEENRDYFLENGGETYRYIPALNESAPHIQMLASLVRKHSWAN